jgi:uncharacterized glyoxalase superfamily protein PhnB
VQAMKILSLCPVLPVQAIEPLLPLWVDDLGFSKLAEVPHNGQIGFVMLGRDGIEIMYQTIDSIAGDDPKMAKALNGQTAAVYLKVDDLDAVEQAIAGHEIVMARRTTFYGSEEIGIRDPAGHVFTFAMFSEDEG